MDSITNWGSLLSATSTIASVLGFGLALLTLILQFKEKNKVILLSLGLLLLIFCLTAISTFYSWHYHDLLNAKRIKKEAEESIQRDATNLVSQVDIPISYWNKGTNEGIVSLGMAFLERNRKHNPKTFDSLIRQISKKISSSKRKNKGDIEAEVARELAEMIKKIVMTYSGQNHQCECNERLTKSKTLCNEGSM